ncbi:voltage-gated potassium channel [Tothia fuscella]|uniref:Voltage-gated potassium channel n=1 Tax=Tothia fuscella TaxID=1048955 RepID=A0A9P4P1C3_9PEZI|nr:voltage-gated potassium channel [Tothia fuscella]
MNDPIDEPIHNAANDLDENAYEHNEELEVEEEQNFLDPSRWWFASTAAPLIAGTFGPMATSFSICALVHNWRLYIPEGGTEAHGEKIKDPPWLIAVNAISLVLAIVANMALLLNMARRLSFAIAQSITIVGYFMSSFLLIALVSVANTSSFRLLPHERHSLTQAFYYAIIAAGIYCIISILMIFTVFGAYKHHYEKEFRLTMSQRTLMLQTIGFMMYLLLGACIFSFIEGWEFLDAVYWADFTLLTIGIGADFTPKTHLGRSLLFPYAIGGVVTVGLVIGSIRTLVLERGKKKMEARFTEKRRQRVLGTMDKHHVVKSGFRKYKFSEDGLTEFQRREQEFNIMRKIQLGAEKRRKWLALGLSTAAALTLWLLGAVVFMLAEKKQQWSYFVSLYFSYTTLLTIGYGDLQPTSNSGKPFFVFWSLLAIPTLTILISNMGDTVVKAFSDLTIWAGSLTILPGENGPKATLRASIDRITSGKSRKFMRKRRDSNTGVKIRQPLGFLPFESGHDDMDKKNTPEDHAMDRLAGHLEKEELEEAEEAGKRGDTLERDLHFYHYVLARELRNLMKDIQASPPKEYTYAEWAFFLKLLGQHEEDDDLHRPALKSQWDDKDQNKQLENVGKAAGDDGELHHWSWLGTRSPLMASKNEANWVMERLASKLESELHRLRSNNPKVKKEKPPISMDDLRKGKNGEGEKSDKDDTSDSSKGDKIDLSKEESRAKEKSFKREQQ